MRGGVLLTLFQMLGFDSSLMGSINALPNYAEYFGLPEHGNASTGIVFAIFQVGLHERQIVMGLCLLLLYQ